MKKVQNSDLVKVHYTGRLTTGEVFDSSVERAPLEFTVGAGQLIKGFDEGVVGMELNEKRTIEIPAAEAYGDVQQQLIQQVDRQQLPPDMHPEIGQTLIATDPEGHESQLLVREVEEGYIVVDGNHPLAGHDLIFDIEVVAIG